MFLFLHTIGKRRYDAVRHSYDTIGVSERTHGNSNRLPHHGFTTNDLKRVVNFLINYAEEHAILLPGRIPGYKRTDLQLLPTQTTKKEVWECYIKASAALTFRLAGYQSFCDIWRKYVPHMIITKPKSDLCWTCQQNSFTASANSLCATNNYVGGSRDANQIIEINFFFLKLERLVFSLLIV